MKKPRKQHWNYFEEKKKIAYDCGYDHPDDMVFDLYKSNYTCSDIGVKLEVNQFCILAHVKRLKIHNRVRGGRNYISLLTKHIEKIKSLPEMNREIAIKLGCHYMCNYRTIWNAYRKRHV